MKHPIIEEPFIDWETLECFSLRRVLRLTVLAVFIIGATILLSWLIITLL